MNGELDFNDEAVWKYIPAVEDSSNKNHHGHSGHDSQIRGLTKRVEMLSNGVFDGEHMDEQVLDEWMF
ncbi:MAG: hypothetical protein Q9215_002553 [Flavoplaca cf. flavocitrina]